MTYPSGSEYFVEPMPDFLAAHHVDAAEARGVSYRVREGDEFLRNPDPRVPHDLVRLSIIGTMDDVTAVYETADGLIDDQMKMQANLKKGALKEGEA